MSCKVFAANPFNVFSREHLLEKVWGYDFAWGYQTVDVHVCNWCRKLEEADEKNKYYIETVRGVGIVLGAGSNLLRRDIFITYMIIVIISLSITGLVTVKSVEKYFIKNTEDTLLTHANVLQSILAPELKRKTYHFITSQ